MALCYFRKAKGLGASCRAYGELCTFHRMICVDTQHAAFQGMLECMLGEYERLSPLNLYPCVANLFRVDAPPAEVAKALAFLCSRQHLNAFCKALSIATCASWTKARVCTELVARMARLFELSHHAKLMWIVVRAQRNFRRRRNQVEARALAGPREHPINDEDPFTLDPIPDLPPEHVFRYKDTHGGVYAFCAPELHYAVKTLGPFNPFTREEIPIPDLFRLSQMMRFIPEKRMPTREESWHTPADAYTTVADIFERKGFVFQVDWLVALVPGAILRVFYEFHMLVQTPVPFMDLSALDHSLRTNNMFETHIVLAKEMLRVAETDHPMQFYFLCNLMIALASVSAPLRRSLPDWMYMGSLAGV